MVTVYKLDHTASAINEKLGKIDSLVKSSETVDVLKDILIKTVSKTVCLNDLEYENAILNADGSFTEHKFFAVSALTPVTVGEVIEYTNLRAPSRGYPFIACYNVNEEYLSAEKVMGTSGDYTSGTFTVPDGVSYVRFVFYRADAGYEAYITREMQMSSLDIMVDNFSTEQAEHNDRISALEDSNGNVADVSGTVSMLKDILIKTVSKTVCLNELEYEHALLNADGSFAEHSVFAVSSLTPVTVGEVIEYTNLRAPSRGYPFIACYNVNEEYLSAEKVVGTSGDYTSGTFTVPDGVSYVRFVFHTADAGYEAYITRQEQVSSLDAIKDDFDNGLAEQNNRITALEESNGVDASETINVLKDILIKTVSKTVCLNETTYENAFLNADGSITGHSVFAVSSLIPVTVGEAIEYVNLRAPSSSYPFIACYDANEVYLSAKKVMGTSGDYTSGTFTVPDGVSYARFVFHTADAGYEAYITREEHTTSLDILKANVDEDQAEQNDRIAALENINHDDLIESSKTVNVIKDIVLMTVPKTYCLNEQEYDNAFLNANGTLSDHASFAVSTFISVTSGEVIEYTNLRAPSKNYPFIACYNANEEYLSAQKVVGTSGDYTSGTFTVPDGVSYVRFVFYTADAGREAYITRQEQVSSLDAIKDDFDNGQAEQNDRISALENASQDTMCEYISTDAADFGEMTTGGISLKGADWEYAHAERTDFIPTDNIVSIKIAEAAVVGYMTALACYDANKTFIAEKSVRAVNDGTLSNGTWTLLTATVDITEDIKYVRFCRALRSDKERYVIITARRSLSTDYKETKETVEELKAQVNYNHWAGKKWYAFGTSLTDSTYIDVNGDPTGKYPSLLNEHMHATLVNCGRGGGGITAHSNGSILNKINSTDFSDADLITLEGFPNDYSAEVGTLLDTTTDTLAGALYVALSTIYQKAPNATVVLITASQGQLNEAGTSGYPIDFISATGARQIEYNDMIIQMGRYFGCHVIDAGGKSQINNFHPQYLVDHIHHSWLGGKQFAETIWEELKNIHCNTDVTI